VTEAETEAETEADASAARRRLSAVDALVFLALFAAALLPRAADLDVFLTPDETRWICRSTNFYTALGRGELAATYQKEHPGVVTMWLGNLGRTVDPGAPYGEACRTVPASRLVTDVAHPTLDEIRERLFAGRVRVAVFVSVGIAAAYLLLVLLLGRPTALLGSLLIAFDPLFLGHARVLHLDAVTTTLMTLSLLALLVHLVRGGSRAALVASGALGGVAALNKSPALFLAPVAACLVLASAWRRGESWRDAVGRLVGWGLAATVAYVALWPAMWVAPARTLLEVMRGALGYAEDAHEGSNYFWGAVRPDPGPAFYPVSWLLRTTPIVVAGLVLAAWGALRRRLDEAERSTLLALLFFALSFGAFMTLGAKKFDRYLLPVYPSLVICASIGWSALAGRAWPLGPSPRPKRSTRAAWAFSTLLLAGISAALALRHHPYYFSYFNPLAGGRRVAEWALLVGWGEGLEQIAHVLNAKPDAETLTVATRYRSAFGPLFRGAALEMDDYDPATLDYYLLYANQVTRDLDPAVIDALYGVATPEAVAEFAGIEYAWLYPNTAHRPVAEFIDARAEAGDAIVVRADSQLAKHYDGPLAVVRVDPDGEPQELLRALDAAFAEHDRLWYVRYDDIVPRPGLAAVDFDLSTGAYTLLGREWPGVRVHLLAPPDKPLANGRLGPPVTVDARFDIDGAGFEAGTDLVLESIATGETPLRWGRDLGLGLGWRLDGAPAGAQTAFLHLIGPDGRRWSQTDKPIADEDLRPTAAWPSGGAATDRYHVPVPAGAPPGAYELQIGVYDTHSGDRVPARVAGEPVPDGTISLPVEVGRPHVAPSSEALDLDVVVEAPVGGGIEWIGYAAAGPVEGGLEVPLGMAWRAYAAPEGDLQAELVALDETGREVGRGTFQPASEQFPTSEWRAGDVVRGWPTLALDGRAVAGRGRIEVRLVDGAGRAVGDPVGAPLEIVGPARTFDTGESGAAPPGATLGDAVTLLSAELDERDVSAGATVPVSLTWRADRPSEVAYTVFVHLRGPDGAVVAQTDRQPLDGRRPTTSWLPGEIVVDPVPLALPEGLPAGEYRLVAGMYDPETLERLAARSPDGPPLPDGAIDLGPLRVRGP
jgi:hypothetical protein